jgi:hypothetical protein
MLNQHLSKIVIIVLIVFLISCSDKSGLKAPEKLGDKQQTKLISGDEAIKRINEVHGLAVAPSANVIVEYGDMEKDLLYISYYDDEIKAAEQFRLMIEKMQKTEDNPFSHMHKMGDGENDVYIALGMGAIHYIYRSSHHLVWFQTYQQTFGRELLQVYNKSLPNILLLYLYLLTKPNFNCTSNSIFIIL